jgi:hypothetical protein
VPPDAPYDESSARPDENQRDYAPSPPPGYEPPPQRDPADALNDPDFKKAKDDWAREVSDSLPTAPPPRDSDSAYDTLVKSIQNRDQR